ncbi:MAG: ArsA family ATPase [Solirubrobacteraceae bacterium]
MSLAPLLAGRSVVICAGAGGVGKTTIAAAVALGLAARGAVVAVVTIDPAKRLAGALGLQELDNEPRLIESARFPGLPCSGELWAMTLDPKRTFDELIDAVAPSAQRAQEVKANRVYRALSGAVAGSQEFTAIAKLYELSRSGRFDVVVLDTPPTHSALEFLDAPARLESFLEGRALRAFVRPAGLGMRVAALGAAPLFAALKRVTGIDLIGELIGFFSLLGGMTEGFRARARDVDALLHAEQTGFLVVSAPQAGPTDEAIWFRRTLAQAGLPFAGAVVNRVHTPLPRGEVALDLAPDLAAKVAATAREHALLAARDAANIDRTREALSGEPVLLVGELDADMDAVQGLLGVRAALFDR